MIVITGEEFGIHESSFVGIEVCVIWWFAAEKGIFLIIPLPISLSLSLSIPLSLPIYLYPFPFLHFFSFFYAYLSFSLSISLFLFLSLGNVGTAEIKRAVEMVCMSSFSLFLLTIYVSHLCLSRNVETAETYVYEQQWSVREGFVLFSGMV